MKHYQIVIKGIVSNKIDLIETTRVDEYLDFLKQIKKCSNLILITTNIY